MGTARYDVSVIYLFYIPYGSLQLLNFINSYKSNNAGYYHDLVIVFKGMSHETETQPFIEILNEHKLQFSVLNYTGEGLDVNAYYWAATQMKNEYLFFLNTSSVLLAENWLLKFARNLSADIGIIGSTASWQSYYSTIFFTNKFGWKKNKSFVINFRKYKLFIKNLCYWRFLFPSFPNPHIRTNAFIVNRIKYMSIKPKIINTKFKAYLFESGKNNLTSRFLQMGLQVLVMDKYGNLYKSLDWKLSKTYWSFNQENLLVSDNQTENYQHASEEKKKTMSKIAWGNNE